MTEEVESAQSARGFSQRLAELVDGRNVAALARASGVSRPVWWKVLRGKENITTDSLLGMAQVLNVDAGWLLTGKGIAPAEDESAIPVDTRHLSPKTKRLIGIFNKCSRALADALKAEAESY